MEGESAKNRELSHAARDQESLLHTCVIMYTVACFLMEARCVDKYKNIPCIQGFFLSVCFLVHVQ